MDDTLFFQVLNAEKDANCSKEFADDLSIILHNAVCWDIVRGQPMMKKDIRNVRGCFHRHWISTSWCGILVSVDNFVTTTLC